MSNLQVGILLYPDAEELDWAGPFEVFSMAAMGKELDVMTIAQTSEPVRCAKGLRKTGDSGPGQGKPFREANTEQVQQ